MSPAGRKSEGKVKYTLTLDPAMEAEARKLDSNFSRFLNTAGWEKIKREKRPRKAEAN